MSNTNFNPVFFRTKRNRDSIGLQEVEDFVDTVEPPLIRHPWAEGECSLTGGVHSPEGERNDTYINLINLTS